MKNYDPILIQNIMAWVGGIAAVAGLTSKVKNALCAIIKMPQLKTIIGYVSSGLVAFAVPSLYLWLTDQWGFKLAILMGISIWMAASGIYDQYHTKE
jgi:hypothetical protein